ncbi:hypothetical protein Mal4_47130 [Maioricimonas rarisocia]|uniref:Carboxypeptidase regulatory-like domain-containing protein n=1 Tax=Maioricimonas rarisocia TaxID=2528026 RepID=A0A517ZD13_9PLAN|nr:hypothetical protein [Maioricimonas rarisocia]QDU40357.1 hypothetical protein Mal4_47130 [Maioricimonas rarisocia]
MLSFSRTLRRHGLFLLVLCLCCAGCGEEGPYRKVTVPVTGQLLVDGKPPGTPVQITCHSLTGIDQEHPTFSKTVSGENGTFAISTYESGDGVPAGEYAVTFEWKTLNLVSMGYSGPDKLKGKYNDPDTSDVKFTITEDSEPIDLGTIELTTE